MAMVSLAFAPCTIAQNVLDARTASVLAYWEPGDTRSYRVERVRQGPKPARSVYRITLRVLAATESTYTVECLYDSLTVDATPPDDAKGRAVFIKLMRASEGMRVRFETDELGIPMRVTNEDDLERHARKVLDEVLEFAEGPSERAGMEKALAPVLDVETLAQEALEDIGNLLFPFGVAYILDKREEVRAEVPNPLGGPPLRTAQEFTMTRLDSAAATAGMRMRQRVDPQGVEEDMDHLLAELGGGELDAGELAALRATIASVRVTDTMDIEVDLIGAWTTSLRVVRTTEVRGRTEIDTRTYVLH